MKKLPPEVIDYFKRQGAKGGKLGGPARSDNLTPERRKEIAANAAKARWAKAKQKPTAK